MKFVYSLTGASVPVIKEFDIRSNEKVKEGEIVFIDTESKITNSTSGTILGVSAETHTGEEDILNPRNNGTKIRVDVTYGGVYEMDTMQLTCSQNGTSTTFVCSSEELMNSDRGGKLVLVKKGEGSTNTDGIGSVRDVSRITCSDDVCTMTVNNGSVICKGDVYAFYPSSGSNGGISMNTGDFALSSFIPIGLMSVGYDLTRKKVEVMLKNKYFENK